MVRAISWRRIRRASGRDVSIVAELPHLGRLETQGRRDFGDPLAGHRRAGRRAAQELRRNEDVNLVDRPSVQQAAQQAAAPFDQDVG